MNTAVRHCMCVAAAMMMVACGGNTSDKSGKRDESAGKLEEPADKQVLSVVHLKRPSVSLAMSHEEAVLYTAEHFWDDLLREGRQYPCDSALVSGVPLAEVEQAIADYAFLMSSLPLDKAADYVEAFASKLLSCAAREDNSNVFPVVDSLFQRYMYDPNSPVRDEDVYGPYASVMASGKVFSPGQRQNFAAQAAKCSLNRRGTVAADFGFVTLKGRQYRLHGIKADYTILFFSNPGCHACKEIIEALGSIEPLQQAIAQGRIAVVNVYIDEDVKAWRDYAGIYPENWYNGFDNSGAVRMEELYDVRAIPSLYLLDKDKRVLLKDAPLEKLLNTQIWQ